MADLATLETRLTEAEAAYHKLMTGAAEVTVRMPDGLSVTYNEVNADKLAAYIVQLQGEIAALDDSSGITIQRRIGVRFTRI